MADEREGERRPPQNADAERAVLGALLLAQDRVPEIAEVLRPEDFSTRRHQTLFQVLIELSNKSIPIDFLSVGEALDGEGRFQAVGGHEYLIELAQSVTTAAHLSHHAQIVALNSTLRRLIEESTAIIEEAYQTRAESEHVRRLVDESEERIFKVARSEGRTEVDSIRSVLDETFRRIDAQAHRRGLTGLRTGFYDMDELLCGLNAGDLIVLAARPSMGKTALALNMIEAAARNQPEWLDRKPVVLLFSLEMGRQQIASRMLCSLAKVDAHKLRTGRIPTEDYSALSEAAGELNLASIFIDDTPGLSAMTLRGRARRLMAQVGLDLIVVDYLQLMSHPRAESRQMEISAISRALKSLARELNVPVVALAQLSRQVELREKKVPQLSDLRESGSIEQDADVVLLLHRPEYYDRDNPDLKNKAHIIVAKHRNGPTGDVELRFFANHMRFENATPTDSVTINL